MVILCLTCGGPAKPFSPAAALLHSPASKALGVQSPPSPSAYLLIEDHPSQFYTLDLAPQALPLSPSRSLSPPPSGQAPQLLLCHTRWSCLLQLWFSKVRELDLEKLADSVWSP